MTVNLSGTKLPNETLNILEKGLTFIPTRKVLPVKTIIETKENLIRRLKLNSYFLNKQDDRGNAFSKKFVEKSNFTPPADRLDRAVLDLVSKINAETDKFLHKHKRHIMGAERGSAEKSLPTDQEKFIKLFEKPNISKTEQETINSLRTNNELIIKPADKGGATVVMSRLSYIREARRQLNNTK